QDLSPSGRHGRFFFGLLRSENVIAETPQRLITQRRKERRRKIKICGLCPGGFAAWRGTSMQQLLTQRRKDAKEKEIPL
ncbi:MAG: hypothetical protein RBT16_12415, partial [Desulfococcus multivorans]|nr:hypothetical protein [Desulfococcus multivorans]